MTGRISSDTAKNKGLPDLPEGWRYELHSFDPNVIHIVWPDHGAVSVHFKRRTVAAGWTIPNPASREAMLKRGKGWKEELVADAVRLLKAAWIDTTNAKLPGGREAS